MRKLNSLNASRVSGAISGSEYGMLAEISSFQLEYTAVAQATGKKEHWEKVTTVLCPPAIKN